MKLADLTFDHPLAKYLQKTLGRFKGKGHKAGAKSCRYDDRPIHLVRRKQTAPCIQKLPPLFPGISFLDQSSGRTLFNQAVDRAQGKVQDPCHFSLGHSRIL